LRFLVVVHDIFESNQINITMKKMFVCFMALCTLTVTAVSAQKMDQASKNIKFYGQVWDVVVNEGRVNVLDTAFADNVILHTTPAVNGKANAIAYYANYVTGFSNRQFTVRESLAQGNKVVKYWNFKGKHTGTFFGIPATNKDVDVVGCTIATIVNGKITEERDFMDMLEFLQQLGIMPR
jgi:steroid delta-isomerase-like uncharacterized protein